MSEWGYGTGDRSILSRLLALYVQPGVYTIAPVNVDLIYQLAFVNVAR